VPHLVNRDQLYLARKVALIHIIQVVMLIHVLADSVKLHGTGLVEDFDNILFGLLSFLFIHDFLPKKVYVPSNYITFIGDRNTEYDCPLFLWENQ
jgi:hypothetical protein